MSKLTMYGNIPNKLILDKEESKHLTGYASIDKPWLKYYDKDASTREYPKKTFYRYAKDNNSKNMNLTAINYYGTKISFSKFFKKIDEVASSLVSLGVKENDVVTICSPTFPETIYLNYALNKIGAVANNIDPRTNAKRIEENLNKVNSKILVMLDIAYPKIDSIIRNTNVEKVICNSYTDSIPALKKPFFNIKLKEMLTKKGLPLPNIDFNDLYISFGDFLKLGTNIVAEEVPYEENKTVAMVLTGGTTGFPKSVELTNDTIIALIEQYKDTDLGLEKGQSLLNIMPQFIAYGWSFGVVMAPSLGVEDIIIPQFDQNEFASYILKYKPNHIVGVPTHYTALMKDKKMKNVDLSKFLKSISAGGDYFLEGNEEEFNNFLHLHGFDKNVIVGFGLTECNSCISTRLNKCNILGSSGVPLAKNTVSIFKIPSNKEEEYTKEELKYNEYGEICITGPTMMKGYFKNEEKTKEVQIMHDDGLIWTHTKDRGYITEDGILYSIGRIKRMIIRPDGHNVWPLEMENIIKHHPLVSECCVVGIPSSDTTQGEFPMALVVLKDENTKKNEEVEKELRELCLKYLPERDVPFAYSFEKELPLTKVGKVDFETVQENIKKKIKRK